MTTDLQLPTLGQLMTRLTGDEKHSAAATSTLDVLAVLYDSVLDVSPDRMDDPDRDRFYLSKGHGPMAYYAVLASHGYFPVEWLDSFGDFGSPLGFHPDRNLVPGVEISSGSLGHGLPLAVGTGLGLYAQDRQARVVVLVGDAELDEGSNHEAIEFAAAARLGNLTVVIIDNHSSSYAVRGRIAKRFSVNGWHTTTVDGRNRREIERSLAPRERTSPTAIIAQVEDMR